MVFVAWAFIAWVRSVLVAKKGESGGNVFVSGISIILGGMHVYRNFFIIMQLLS